MTDNSKYLALLLVQFLPFAFYYKYNNDNHFWWCVVAILIVTAISYAVLWEEDVDNTQLKHRTFFMYFGLIINSLLFLLI